MRFIACTVLVLAMAVPVPAAAADDRLVTAVRERSPDAVDALLREGVDVNVPQADGATALAWAVHWDDHDLTGRLLDAGADVNAANDYGVTPLALACLNRSVAMVERLLAAGADPALAQANGETPLMTAARTGHPDIAARLIAAGADVDARTAGSQQTGLMWAAAGGHTEVVRVLIAAGADVHALTDGEFTALFFAAQQGATGATHALLDASADVDTLAPDGHTALMIATASRHSATAVALIERGADPNLTEAGYTALHLAVPRNQVDVVRALLAHGADPNARVETAPLRIFGPGRGAGSEVPRRTPGAEDAVPDHPVDTRAAAVDSNQTATAFFLAAKQVNQPLMEILVEGGADPELTIDDGTAPLMVAAGLTQVQGPRAQRGDVSSFYTVWNLTDSLEAVRYLTEELGVDVNAVNQAGQTALQGAAYMGADPMVEFLITQGALLDVQDTQGQTAYRIAEAHLNTAGQSITFWPETAALLRQLGANTTLGVDGQEMIRDFTRRAGERLR